MPAPPVPQRDARSARLARAGAHALNDRPTDGAASARPIAVLREPIARDLSYFNHVVGVHVRRKLAYALRRVVAPTCCELEKWERAHRQPHADGAVRGVPRLGPRHHAVEDGDGPPPRRAGRPLFAARARRVRGAAHAVDAERLCAIATPRPLLRSAHPQLLPHAAPDSRLCASEEDKASTMPPSRRRACRSNPSMRSTPTRARARCGRSRAPRSASSSASSARGMAGSTNGSPTSGKHPAAR